MATVRQDGQHIWNTLSDADLLRSAGLWRRDLQSGQEGYTLAAALLFGKNKTIREVLPYYEFDAILRQVDLDRYDDRDYVQSSLLDAIAGNRSTRHVFFTQSRPNYFQWSP